MNLTDEQIKSLAEFALDVLEDWPDVGSLDGGDLQEIAEKHKILIPHIVHGPCGEDCYCEQFYSDGEMQSGVTCYRIVDWLVRDAQLRIGADDAGQNGACQHNFVVSANKEWYAECVKCGMKVAPF